MKQEAVQTGTPLVSAVLGRDKIRRIVRMLAVPSIVSVAMVLGRFAYVGDLRFRFCGLLLNLLLAWIPMALALVICLGPRRRPVLMVLVIGWLLFFPNAFYIITDLIHDHKFGMDGVYRWYDILMTACFSVSGMFLGTFSLYLLHSIVRARFGRGAGWFFAGAVLALSSYGTYLGRVLRLNSWDAVLRPGALFQTILTGSGRASEIVLFCGGFFLFSAVVYSFIVSAVHLHEPSSRDL